MFYGWAVDLGELSSNVGWHPGNFIYDGEWGEKQDTNNGEGDHLAEKVVPSCVNTILPNDISRLRGFLKFYWQAENLSFGL